MTTPKRRSLLSFIFTCLTLKITTKKIEKCDFGTFCTSFVLLSVQVILKMTWKMTWMLMSTPSFNCVPPLPEMKHHGVVVFSERNQTDLPRKTACTRPVDDCWG